jgi:hypothetical protein
MPLEPSEEQRMAIEGAIADGLEGDIEGLDIDPWPAWALIRDMVLEAAARECDRYTMAFAAARIRAMKGTP